MSKLSEKYITLKNGFKASVYCDSRGFTIEVNDKQSEGSKIIGIFFNFFGQVIDQFNISCRRYRKLERIRVSRFFGRFGRSGKQERF